MQASEVALLRIIRLQFNLFVVIAVIPAVPSIITLIKAAAKINQSVTTKIRYDNIASLANFVIPLSMR